MSFLVKKPTESYQRPQINPLHILTSAFILFNCVGQGVQKSFYNSENEPRGTFLWEITSNQDNLIPPSYLFGTIHVPYSRVWDAVPLNVKRAFSNSNQVHFELDLTDPSTLSALSACQLLPQGQHISQYLPTSLYLSVEKHLDLVRKAMSTWMAGGGSRRTNSYDSDYLFSVITSNWKRKRPIWVMMMINSLTKSELMARGIPVLDLFLAKLADRQGKKIGAIENVSEQCEPLNELDLPKVIFALNQSLTFQSDLLFSSSTDVTTDDLIEQYREGNLESKFFDQDTFQLPIVTSLDDERERKRVQLTREEEQMSKEIVTYFREKMIAVRNKRMAARIIDHLVNRPDSYFFAFGVGHFVGEKSIIEFLETAGLKVRRIRPGETLTHRNGNSIHGTFDDLPEEEKTKALLQFLQYTQSLERANETRRFSDMLPRGTLNSEDSSSSSTFDESSAITIQTSVFTTPSSASSYYKDDEKTIEQSLKVWYGLEDPLRSASSAPALSPSFFMVKAAQQSHSAAALLLLSLSLSYVHSHVRSFL